MADPIKLPPGATLVSDGSQSMPLPPGATLVSPGNFNANAEAPKPTELPGASQQLKKFAVGMPIGAIKSLAQVQANSPVGTLAAGMPSAPAGQVPGVEQRLQLQGAGEHVGAGLEQAGEMALTGGPLRQGAETLLTKLPFLGKFMGPGSRVAAEAVNTAANAQMHGQDPNAAALAGVVGTAASEGLPFLQRLLRQSAETQYGKILNPTTLRNKNITQKAVPQLLNRNVVSTESGLLDKAQGQVSNLGEQIDTAVKNVPASVKPNTQNVLDSLDRYKQQFTVNGVAVNQGAVDAANNLQQMVQQLGPNVSYQSLNRVRQILDKGVARAGGYTGKTLAEGSVVDAQAEAANAIRAELSRQSPDIAKINAEFHLWKGVQDVMQATAERRTGQAGGLIHNLLPWMAGAAGLAHGGLTPSGGLESFAAAATMMAVDSGLRSGLIRSLSAVGKARLADLIASGNTQAVTQFLTRAGAAGASQIPRELNTTSTTSAAQQPQQ